MPPPALDSFAKALYKELGPMAFDDANQQYALANFCGGLGAMFQIVEDLSRDQVVNGKTLPGWSQVMDINRVPGYAIAWLGQFVGVQPDMGLSVANQRTQVANVGGWRRGTRDSLIAAVKLHLTGSKTILFRERYDPNNPAIDSPYFLYAITYTAETPTPSQTLADIIAQKPAGIVLNYVTIAGQDWQAVKNDFATWQDVKNHYSTWNGVKADQPGF